MDRVPPESGFPDGSAMSAKLKELRARGFQSEGFREGYEAREFVQGRGVRRLNVEGNRLSSRALGGNIEFFL